LLSGLEKWDVFFRDRHALELIRGLIERVELHPDEDGFRIELLGEIANMVTLSAGAESVGSELGRASVKMVAGTRNQRCLQALRARLPTILPLTAATPVRIR